MEVCGLWLASLGGVLWELMTNPSSMLVPDHCIRKGQHSTFDDSWTRSYLRGAWEKFAGNVTISIINLSHMCAYSAILRLKIIKKQIYRGDRAQQDTTWHLSKGGTERDNPQHRFQTGWCCATVTNQSILPRILGISDIYRWMVGPLWIHIYIYFEFSSGWGWRLPVKPYFFSFFFISHSQHCLKMSVSCCKWFLNKFSIQTPLWLSLNSLDNNIFTWYFLIRDYEYMPFVNPHSKFKNRLIGCTHIA